MDILKVGMDLLDPATVVNSVVGGLIVLFFSLVVGGISGIVVFNYKWKKAEEAKQREKLEQEQNKEAERKNENRILTGRLLSEIHRNQKLLKPLSDAVSKVLESDDRPSEDIKLPNELKISKSIYLKSSNKLRLLDDESRELIDKYYPELMDIENEFYKLDMIHGASHEYLGYLVLWNRPEHFDYHDNILGGEEIEAFLRHTRKVYDFGADLIISLEDNNGA